MKLYNFFLLAFIIYTNFSKVFSLNNCQHKLFYCKPEDKILCCKGLICNTNNDKSYYGYCDFKN